MNVKLNSGTTGWLALAAGVVVWDLYSAETLTGAFRRANLSPTGRVVVMAGWGILTGHLFSLIPPRIDPLDFGHYTVIMRRTTKGRRELMGVRAR
jgi:hypothetical protein